MSINEAVALAARLESLIRRADTFGKDRVTILEEVNWIASDLRDYADRLDAQMEKELCDDRLYLSSL
jgi:hypothetical protein